ncbi:hypothetical protein GCM10010492_44510 [Saccharothrix mutabilis subsp. mutabilis]|uniref:AB hydrolase-1 domain-containing protein n=1 Tax=Saccharothrix mutabilis subsp. mutabilis TaxID=66855 RepID=A0ABN0U6S1_9PSEU
MRHAGAYGTAVRRLRPGSAAWPGQTASIDGRTIHAHDTGTGGFPAFWLHGTPNTGAPPEPLFADADRLGLRWVSYDRPGHGGSTRTPGRDVASAARDVAAVADALDLDRFAVVGHSGGAPHAPTCAALPPSRVTAAVVSAGRAEKEAYEAAGVEYDPEFTDADLAALDGPWSWFERVAGPAPASGPGGPVDDDLAYVSPWGFDPGPLDVPALFPPDALDWVARRR